jgi:hypothetical protein
MFTYMGVLQLCYRKILSFWIEIKIKRCWLLRNTVYADYRRITYPPIRTG